MSNGNNAPKQLMMLRGPAPAPVISLKDGWHVRSMRAGDEEAWTRICKGAGFFATTDKSDLELWQDVMGSDPGVRTENVFFVCNAAGEPVATAAARLIPDGERSHYPATAGSLGYLHFVAALPECRGMGAGSAVSAAVLQRQSDLSQDYCVLTTDDFRLPAIRLYLGMGWLPVLHDGDMRARWERVLGKLGVNGETQAVGADGRPAAPLYTAVEK